MNTLLELMKEESNVAYTDNGALSYSTTKNSIVDFFAQVSAMRSRKKKDIINLFDKAFAEDKLIATKLAFYVRDVRGGQGEREVFRTILNYLAISKPDIVLKNLEQISNYGRWDDLFVLFDTPCQQAMVTLIRGQLTVDEHSDTPTLLAKWMPSCNTSSKKTVALAYRFIHLFNISPRSYRKLLVGIRTKIRLIETKITKRDYSNINYETVPSNANMKYKKAFWRNDEDRYRTFLESVSKGEKKINATTLYPYDIVRSIINSNPIMTYRDYDNEEIKVDLTLDALWNNIPDYVQCNNQNILVMVDNSGSMQTPQNLPLSTAIAMGIYFAEKSKGAFAGHYLSFSQNPILFEVKGTNIALKVANILQKQFHENTNLEKAFDLLLDLAISKNLPQSEMPDRLIIVSDMQFDYALCPTRFCFNGINKNKLMQTIKDKWELAGYKLPKITFWNVDAENETFPMTIDETGVQFVSGHSPTIFTSILKDEFITPYQLVLDVINNERYDVIKV